MRFWKSPLGATILFILVIVAFQFTDRAEAMREIGLLVLLVIMTFLIHEVGHVLFGVVAGYQFHFITAGPITIERGKLRANESWAFFGGVASCSPLTDDLQKISRQHFWFTAGGPIISFLVGAVAFIIGFSFDLQFTTFFGILNMGIFIVTIIPYKGVLKSDGRVMLELLSNGNDKEHLISSMLLFKEMLSPRHPTVWSSHLIEKTRTAEVSAENMGNSYLLFCTDLFTMGYHNASKNINAYKALPVTNKNKTVMQFTTHIKQLDLLMDGNYTGEQIHNLHSMMLPVDPISYKRSEWIMAKIEGNEVLAKKKLAEHRIQIEQGKSLYGFYFAEEKLTDLVEEHLNKRISS